MADTNTPTDRNENMQREQGQTGQGEFDKNRQDKSVIGGEKTTDKSQAEKGQFDKSRTETGQADKSRSEPTSR